MNTYNNNDIKYTPDFVYTPPSALQPKKKKLKVLWTNIYVNLKQLFMVDYFLLYYLCR